MKFSELIQKLGSVASINSLTGCQTTGIKVSPDPELVGVAAIDQAAADTLSFVEGERFASRVGQTQAGALLLPTQDKLQETATARGIAWIATPQPRLLFAQAIALFYQPFRPAPEIHPTAEIHPSAQMGEAVYIGPHVVIQANVQIGDQVCIHPNVVVYPEVQIGDRTVLHANCVIHEQTQIAKDCVVHSGAVIGAEGFAPSPTSLFKVEQSGTVVLEDGVEVGCNSAVNRPARGETRIGSGTKIDNLVQIAHGCQIGQHCALAAQVGLGSGVSLGNQVVLAGQVGVADQVKIGDRAIASAKAGVYHDVAPGTIVSGTPAIPHKIFLRAASIYIRLPEIYQILKQLQRRLQNDD
jgi:UDP-3-O-[3-hydroxymyristoyl] glucosamine N-acyltransferase